MKILNLALIIGLLTASAGMAQGPMYDKITVNIPYAMNVNGNILQPGEYVIRQHESSGSSRILHFFSDRGMKLETTAMAIPALDNRTPTETKLVLDHYGSDYYLNKIWVQGKDYGYEFPLPENIRMRENERNLPATATLRYESTAVTAQTTTPPPEPPVEIAQSAPPPAPVVEPPAPAPEPVQQAQVIEPPPPAEPAAPPEAADRGETTMPATAGNWLSLVLGGGLLIGSGLALRRFRV
jgi:predicted component of type VI protein secretion system